MKFSPLAAVAGMAFVSCACAASLPRAANTQITPPLNKDSSHHLSDLSELPDRLEIFDETISSMKREIALLNHQTTSLQKRLDQIEQQSH